MNEEMVSDVVQLAESILAGGKPGGNPQTFNVQGKDVTVNPISTVIERGYEFTWVDGAEAFTVKIVANSPFGKITHGWN